MGTERTTNRTVPLCRDYTKNLKEAPLLMEKRLVRSLRLSLANFENLGAADRASARGRRLAVLHCGRSRIFDFSFSLALNAIRLHNTDPLLRILHQF